MADWGRAGNMLMRGLLFFIQVLDGFENTQDNVSGKLIELFEQEGFAKVAERQSLPTIFGTMVSTVRLRTAKVKVGGRRNSSAAGNDGAVSDAATFL